MTVRATHLEQIAETNKGVLPENITKYIVDFVEELRGHLKREISYKGEIAEEIERLKQIVEEKGHMVSSDWSMKQLLQEAGNILENIFHEASEGTPIDETRRRQLIDFQDRVTKDLEASLQTIWYRYGRSTNGQRENETKLRQNLVPHEVPDEAYVEETSESGREQVKRMLNQNDARFRSVVHGDEMDEFLAKRIDEVNSLLRRIDLDRLETRTREGLTLIADGYARLLSHIDMINFMGEAASKFVDESGDIYYTYFSELVNSGRNIHEVSEGLSVALTNLRQRYLGPNGKKYNAVVLGAFDRAEQGVGYILGTTKEENRHQGGFGKFTRRIRNLIQRKTR